MIKKTFHQRGLAPQRDVHASVTGRIYAEHVDAIVKLYVLDGMTIEDIARLYGVECSGGIGQICRRGKLYMSGLGDAQDQRYFDSASKYALALKTLIEKPRWTCIQVGRVAGLPARIVRQIAKRNGVEKYE